MTNSEVSGKGYGIVLVETLDETTRPAAQAGERLAVRKAAYVHSLTCDIPLDAPNYQAMVDLAERSYDRIIRSFALSLGLPDVQSFE